MDDESPNIYVIIGKTGDSGGIKSLKFAKNLQNIPTNFCAAS